MAFYIDAAAGRIVEVGGEVVPEPGWFVIDPDTATVCGLRSGQSVSRDQIAALHDKAAARFLALAANSSEPAKQVAARPAPQTTAGTSPTTAQRIAFPPHSTTYVVASIVALLAWLVAAASCLMKYNEAQTNIRSAFDISAIQIQQLNGEVAAHGITTMIVAMALTVPALLLKR